MTKKESLFYTYRMDDLDLTCRKVLRNIPNKRGFKAELCRVLGINQSSLCNALNGTEVNPKILVRVYEHLKNKHNNRYFEHFSNLTKREKSYDSLLMNGFSHWEAIRIAND